MSPGPEATYVEDPFLDQLALMGWKLITGSVDDPTVSGRSSFREVLLRQDLSAALKRINLRDGAPWLDDARVATAIGALEHINHPRLLEANKQATGLLLRSTTVEGLPGWVQGRTQTVRYIDWEHPENNQFLAISQFKVECPGGQTTGSIRPDITLFINGIPVVVVECKSPGVSEPMAEAVDQLRRYHNDRKATFDTDENEGNERLFYTNQFLVASSFDEARVGTIGAQLSHYLEWKDTAPVPLDQVKQELGKEVLSSQNRLIAGMLRPAHLLDIIQHFTVFNEVAGRKIKAVCRYQQFRAVQYAVERLRSGKTREQDGSLDRRGGIIWHTQGSGKSLTMVFLVRKLRSDPLLRRFKVVVITDRKDLERQLAGTAGLTGETVHVGKSIGHVKKLLRAKGPGLVFAMIQKYVDRDLSALGPDEAAGDLGMLNDSEAVLVMIDEAHRSHGSALHAALMQALPNCARIGFTGTPIIMGKKKETADIFGEFIDQYTIKEAEADGATVPILYEGRTVKGAVKDGRNLDDLFATEFADYDEEAIEAIKAKHATKAAVVQAEQLLAEKARDMLRHYVEFILPQGLKAQVVAYGRLSAVRYQNYLVEARDELVAEAEAVDPATRELTELELGGKPKAVQQAVRAARFLAELKALEFAAVISGGHNDPPELAEWSDGAKIESRIARFKQPLRHPDPQKADPLAFLCVKSMLLTGFDAPIEGVMYLDRGIREAELLQAIARVNRTGHGKTAGIIVDYAGVASNLKEALCAYSAEDIEGALKSLADEIPKLRDQHERVLGVFQSRDVDAIADVESAVDLLKDERIRAEFTVKLKQFLATLDLVLPRPDALPFVRNSSVLGEIHKRARNKYREGPELDRDIGKKVQALIDQHLLSLGIDPRIPPLRVTDAAFKDHIGRQVSDRAKASEMEHAIRHHIKKKLEEDPVYYQRLSERLEEILKQFGEDWAQQSMALAELTAEIQSGGRKADDGLGLSAVELAFYDVLLREMKKDQPVSNTRKLALAQETRGLLEQVLLPAVRTVDFWKSTARSRELHGKVFQFLDENEIVDLERADAVADDVLGLAKAKHGDLVK